MSGNESDFEIAFVTEPLPDPTDPRIDNAMEQVPNLIVANHGDLTVITTLSKGTNAVSAAAGIVRALRASGIGVERSYQDLVSRQDIAGRLAVTRQAVGNWVRGERKDDPQFPAPTSLVSGGIWLWGDVANWASKHGFETDGFSYPSREDHNMIDMQIRASAKPSAVGAGEGYWLDLHARLVSATVRTAFSEKDVAWSFYGRSETSNVIHLETHRRKRIVKTSAEAPLVECNG